ncbi:MAG: hypothetical protein QM820_20845 [Minicystis sp.]
MSRRIRTASVSERAQDGVSMMMASAPLARSLTVAVRLPLPCRTNLVRKPLWRQRGAGVPARARR